MHDHLDRIARLAAAADVERAARGAERDLVTAMSAAATEVQVSHNALIDRSRQDADAVALARFGVAVRRWLAARRALYPDVPLLSVVPGDAAKVYPYSGRARSRELWDVGLTVALDLLDGPGDAEPTTDGPTDGTMRDGLTADALAPLWDVEDARPALVWVALVVMEWERWEGTPAQSPPSDASDDVEPLAASTPAPLPVQTVPTPDPVPVPTSLASGAPSDDPAIRAGATRAECDILTALGDGVMQGADLAAKAGYSYGHTRTVCAGLCGAGVLESTPRGYRRIHRT